MSKSQYVTAIILLLLNSPPALSEIHIQISPKTADSTTTNGSKKENSTSSDETIDKIITNPHTKIDLVEAISLLKSAKIRDQSGDLISDIYLHLEIGTYRLDKPILLDKSSSGSQKYTIYIVGPDEGEAILTGSKPLINLTPVTNKLILNQVTLDAQSNLLETSLPAQGINDYGKYHPHGYNHFGAPKTMELIFRGEPMTISRWPNTKHISISSSENLNAARQFKIAEKDVSRWQLETDISAFGYWFYSWADETLKVESIDGKNGLITLADPGPAYGIKAGQPIFFQGILSELDKPGEWYLSKKNGMVYLWPPSAPEKDDIEATTLDSLVLMNSAHNINIAKITFQNVRGTAIIINDGNKIDISDSTLKNTGNSGVLISGTDSGLTRVKISNAGESGAVLSGGDRVTLKPGNLYVKKSTIQQTGRTSRTSPAVSISGVGNSVTDSEISNTPHSAVIFQGNNHIVSGNHISRVCLETGDAGAIYTGRDWTARGTIISNNTIEDIPSGIEKGGVFGIYLDDQASGIIVRSNKLVKTNVGVFIGGGRDNIIEGNTIIDSVTASIHLDARGLKSQKKMTDDPNGPLQTRLKAVPYSEPPYADQYPHLANLLEDELGSPKYNVVLNNIISGKAQMRIWNEAKPGITILNNTINNR